MLAPERKHRGSGVWSRKEIENFLLAPKAIRRVLAARIKDKEVAVHPDRRLRGLVLLIVQEAVARRYDGRPVGGGNWHGCHRLGLSRSRFLVPAGPVGHEVFRLFPIGEKGRSAAELSGKSSRGEDQTGAALPALFALPNSPVRKLSGRSASHSGRWLESVFPCKLLILNWRREWDSFSKRVNRICKLQKRDCRKCHKCHRSRGPLPAIARCVLDVP